MIKQNKHDILQPDVFDVLSAAWVMSCNDENPIMTYEGIRHRMRLSSSFDVRSLIQSRGDLFRRGVSDKRLEEWKSRLLEGKNLPTWIREIEDEEKRKQAINGLTVNDVFRSQFRFEENAPRASLQVIDWGLQHVDRLRKASFDAKDKSAKSWQMWLVFVVSLLNILATIISALLKKG